MEQTSLDDTSDPKAQRVVNKLWSCKWHMCLISRKGYLMVLVCARMELDLWICFPILTVSGQHGQRLNDGNNRIRQLHTIVCLKLSDIVPQEPVELCGTHHCVSETRSRTQKPKRKTVKSASSKSSCDRPGIEGSPGLLGPVVPWDLHIHGMVVS